MAVGEQLEVGRGLSEQSRSRGPGSRGQGPGARGQGPGLGQRQRGERAPTADPRAATLLLLLLLLLLQIDQRQKSAGNLETITLLSRDGSCGRHVRCSGVLSS
ncbi:hypothetical protein EYF80_057028 [Liparis tanakae]|uniref:Uncharacterized protein n=1 Tax=Liparis tanakae TaxID=230148 RepID=A0A4Z2EVH5_9TELE|nr:hypothetical protein EYF80_057028 [Liparis tanakae]